MSRILGLQRLSVSKDDPTALVDSNLSICCGGVLPSVVSVHCGGTGDD